jgi:hypothetical protein
MLSRFDSHASDVVLKFGDSIRNEIADIFLRHTDDCDVGLV